jgi:hypothetical protein
MEYQAQFVLSNINGQPPTGVLMSVDFGLRPLATLVSPRTVSVFQVVNPSLHYKSAVLCQLCADPDTANTKTVLSPFSLRVTLCYAFWCRPIIAIEIKLSQT